MSAQRSSGSAPGRDRRAGLLLHPTSLPGRFSIGDLGPAAFATLDWLVDCRLAVWQMLPLGPTGLGHSPYNAFSAFAGNPLLISPEALLADGLSEPEDLAAAESTDPGRVDYAAAEQSKDRLLRRAFAILREGPRGTLQDELERFASAAGQTPWLDDWALFAALKARHGGAAWTAWAAPLRDRRAAALAEARRELADDIAFHRFVQFLFFRQWDALRAAARARGVALLGDVPIYVAADSADVWAHRELFDTTADGKLRAVAGVPPDYFSDQGQRWGNPLYRWDRLKAQRFAWWVARLRIQLQRFDLLRLDHFRGFVAYWRVPAASATATRGRWVRGPGEALFRELRRALGGDLPLLAEDLGDIDAKVHAVRRKLGLPGMKVLQFAFGEEDSTHLPHHHEPLAAVYTGTHDNDTTRGWFELAQEPERRRALAYLGGAPESVSWSLVRAAFTSVAALAVVPLQDFLDLGSAARMNTPGQESGNWTWRLRPDQVPADLPARIRELAAAAGRRAPRGG